MNDNEIRENFLRRNLNGYELCLYGNELIVSKDNKEIYIEINFDLITKYTQDDYDRLSI